MSSFILGFIGVLTGALTVAVVLFVLYRYEMAKRDKMAQELSNDLQDLLKSKLKYSSNNLDDYEKDSRFN